MPVRAAPELASELEVGDQIVVRYDAVNPNGSVGSVAGVVNGEASAMGLAPHPERAVDPLLGSADGALILASLLDAARERVLASVS